MRFNECTLEEIARVVQGVLEGGEPAAVVRGVASLAEAGEGDLSFLANPRYQNDLASTRATAVLVGGGVVSAPCALIRVENPDLAFARAVGHMAPPPPRPAEGVHPTAVVAKGAQLGRGVAIGAYVVIEPGSRLGSSVTLWPGVYLGTNVLVGDESILMPHVVVHHDCVLGRRVIVQSGAVIGSDGFGYVWDGRAHVKIPQVGKVVIEDDVEIGANTTIDRARFGTTRIGVGTKLDNLVQIAHNVTVGPHCAFAAQVGISGSATIGGGTLMGGQSGTVGHIELGPGSRLSAKTGVTKNLPGGEQYTGFPARPHAQALQDWSNIRSLARLRERVKELERRIEKLGT
ncbi:MAG: UDP-3-O-(3-hydroxymyristoyl)glucosamine N-acyltransferase [Planctomycetota bacterium]